MVRFTPLYKESNLAEQDREFRARLRLYDGCSAALRPASDNLVTLIIFKCRLLTLTVFMLESESRAVPRSRSFDLMVPDDACGAMALTVFTTAGIIRSRVSASRTKSPEFMRVVHYDRHLPVHTGSPDRVHVDTPVRVRVREGRD